MDLREIVVRLHELNVPDAELLTEFTRPGQHAVGHVQSDDGAAARGKRNGDAADAAPEIERPFR